MLVVPLVWQLLFQCPNSWTFICCRGSLSSVFLLVWVSALAQYHCKLYFLTCFWINTCFAHAGRFAADYLLTNIGSISYLVFSLGLLDMYMKLLSSTYKFSIPCLQKSFLSQLRIIVYLPFCSSCRLVIISLIYWVAGII